MLAVDMTLIEKAMFEAIKLAERGRPHTAPNPCVGAVLLRDGIIVAEGFHERYGEAHAEVKAIADARAKGIDPAACSLVVTLEPCSHTGKTPPCTEAVLDAGIRKVFIGCLDPTPEAAGGTEILREKGIEVTTGILERECRDLIADFITWKTTELPYTYIKLASTLDGRIATRTGHSQWISCEEARRLTHELRRNVGAVIVGGNTFYHDNPRLTCRPTDNAAFTGKQPLAVVVTSRLPSADHVACLTQDRPTESIFWTTVAAAASPKAEALRKKGVVVLGLPSHPRIENDSLSGMRAALDLRSGLLALRRDYGCHYVLCEGGGRLALSLLAKNLMNELYLHLSPRVLGDNEATPLFDGMSPLQIDDGIALRITGSRQCGNDLIIALRPGLSPAEQQNGVCEE